MEQAATIGELRRGLVSGLRRRDSPGGWEGGNVMKQWEDIMEWREGGDRGERVMGGTKGGMKEGAVGREEQDRRERDGREVQMRRGELEIERK